MKRYIWWIVIALLIIYAIVVGGWWMEGNSQTTFEPYEHNTLVE